jgi:hypothetical protein
VRINANTKVILCKSCCCVKAVRTTHSPRVFVALVIQHTKRIRRIIWLSVARVALPYLSALSHERHELRKKVVAHKVYFDFLYNVCLKLFSFKE